ncbi:hypothetical protein EXIGLDRAFT_839224 [Exidia glandulosa HHB12029]|uniref:BTB domain-containing protein n=1 Tax=Exidia glandulosa HHB12029 TaxID=1314781 RepID=A0A165F5Y5_EXIGL|nr:hypothetical protein EXIGLDRAFT_839224 [Exidia glandulosa HHB12029]
MTSLPSTLSFFTPSSSTPHPKRASLPASPFATAVRRRPFGTTKSTKYWYEDGSVVFLVQKTLYKVHKSLLASAGERFADMFAVPPPGNGLGTEEDPMILTDLGVTSQGFEALLSVIYISLPLPTFTTADLVHILRLSSLLRCHTLRHFALDTLSTVHHARNMSALEMLRLAKECNVAQWVLPPLLEFSRLRTPLPVELGAELIARLAQARDVLLSRRISLILHGEVDLGVVDEYRVSAGNGMLPSIEEQPEDHVEHDECGDIIRRELTRLHALSAEEAPFPPEILVRSLPHLRIDLCARCSTMPITELELRVRAWLDLEGDLPAIEGILVGKS